MSDTLSTRQKVALCAALGTGVVFGASGLVVYQVFNFVRAFFEKFNSYFTLIETKTECWIESHRVGF